MSFQITEDRLYQTFSIKGHITDCSLKYTKEGVFRKFAFIGFRNEEDCISAVNYFNNTYIDTSKIQVCYFYLINIQSNWI